MLPECCRLRTASVSKIFKYLSLANLYYLTEGLTFDISKCADVLDAALVSLNKQTKIPDKIYAWNGKDPMSRAPLSFPGRGRIIVDVTQSRNKEGKDYLPHSCFRKK
jgi:hypothetical protein